MKPKEVWDKIFPRTCSKCGETLTGHWVAVETSRKNLESSSKESEILVMTTLMR